MLQNTNPLLHNFKINGLDSHDSLQQKQVFLTDLVLRAKVDVSNLEFHRISQDVRKSELSPVGSIFD